MGLIKYWNKNRSKVDFFDMGLIKFCMIALTLFVITIWSGAMDLVHSIHWGWFLAACVVLGARPFYRYYIRRK